MARNVLRAAFVAFVCSIVLLGCAAGGESDAGASGDASRRAAEREIARINKQMAKAQIKDRPKLQARRGMLYVEAGQYDKAVMDLRQQPHTPDKRIPLALAYRGQKKYDLAIRVLQHAAHGGRGQPPDPRAAVLLGQTHLEINDPRAAYQSAETFLRSGERADLLLVRGEANQRLNRMPRALADYTRAIELAPDDPLAYAKRAIAHQIGGDARAALADAEQAVKRQPKNPLGYRIRAVAHAALGRHDEAIRDLSVVLRAQPKDASALHARGLAYAQVKQGGKALKDLEAAQALGLVSEQSLAAIEAQRRGRGGGSVAAADMAAGRRAYMAGQYAQALRAFDAVVAASPDNADAHAWRGKALFDSGRAADAVAAYDRAIALRPKHPDAWIGRAQANAALKRAVPAKQDVQRAIALEPKNIEARYMSATIHCDLGDPSTAWQEAQAVVRMKPDHARAHYTSGIAAYHLGLRKRLTGGRGEYESAVRSFDQAIRFDRDFFQAYLGRSSAYLGLRQIGMAILDAKIAIEKRPNAPEGYYQLSQVYAGARDAEQEAIAAAQKAVDRAPGQHAYVQNLERMKQRVRDRESGELVAKIIVGAIIIGALAPPSDSPAATGGGSAAQCSQCHGTRQKTCTACGGFVVTHHFNKPHHCTWCVGGKQYCPH